MVSPTPFYQTTKRSLLAGADTGSRPRPGTQLAVVDWAAVPQEFGRRHSCCLSARRQPDRRGHGLDEWKLLFEPATNTACDCVGRVLQRDLLPGRAATGRLAGCRDNWQPRFQDIIALTSLSKRSNVPGLRSGFVAGDAVLIKPFLLYRTYHGSAMSPIVQAASIAAWDDETHVVANRAMYREKFASVTPLLAAGMDVALPDAGFYLWAQILERFNGDDAAFSRELLALYNVVVLPGSYLAREARGHNPGAGRIRMALVAETAECVEAAERIVQFIHSTDKAS